MCMAWHKQFNLPVKIVRPFNAYGPGMNLNDGRVYTDFIWSVINNKDLVIKSDGKPIRSFCYLADSIIGFFIILLKGSPGGVYNLGNPRSAVSVLNLAQTLVRLFPDKKLKVIIKEEQSGEKHSSANTNIRSPDIAKLEALGWNPTYSLEEGFSRTIRSYLK